MTQNGKIIPNLDQERTKQINLTVLQRLDPFVEEILMTAAHVTLYEFNADINQWSRKDVEGSLFVVKRNEQPRFQFIVMNRRSTENLVEDLLGDFEYEVQSPYLLYRNAAQEVNGIWFYNAQDCEAVANLFSRILNAFSKVPPKSIASIKSEFEELEAVPSLDVIEGPLEPQRSTSATVPDASDSSFLNFFNAAMNTGNASNMSNAVQQNPTSTAIPVPSCPIKTIEHPMPSLQSQSSLQNSSNPLLPPLLDTHKSSARNNHATNLINPSLFSSSLMMPPIQIQPSVPTVTMQQPYGTPLLQPFPPPTPPPYLTPPSTGPIITKDKVRDALMRLVKNDQFIDMVHRELLNAYNS